MDIHQAHFVQSSEIGIGMVAMGDGQPAEVVGLILRCEGDGSARHFLATTEVAWRIACAILDGLAASETQETAERAMAARLELKKLERET